MDSPYPSRRYADGKSTIEGKKLIHYCTFGKFKTLRNAIGADAWQELKNSSVGVFLQLVDMEMTQKFMFSGNIVHYFLNRQLEVNNEHEFWSVIDGRPLRFSLHEYMDITGLNCDPYPTEEAANSLVFEDFWTEMNVCPGGGPTWDHLEKVLKRCQEWSLEKRMMLGKLCILHVGVYGIHHESRLPLDIAKMVVHPEIFETFPWGRKGFSCLLESIKDLRSAGKSYTVHGCVHVLLIWIYESVAAIGELCGFRRGLRGVPPLLNWRGSRVRLSFEDIIAKERCRHGQVRVRHMLPVRAEDVYPQWSDNQQTVDPKLDRLLRDIISNDFVPGCWEARKKGSKKRVLDDQSSKTKKQKKDRKEEERKETMVNPQEKQSALRELYKLVEGLADKLNNLEDKMEIRNEKEREEMGRLDEKLSDFENSVKSELRNLRERAIKGGHEHTEDTPSSPTRIEHTEDTPSSPTRIEHTSDEAKHQEEEGGHGYDPFLPVSEDKWQRFQQWWKKYNVKTRKPEPAGRTKVKEFFGDLLRPREEWDSKKNISGWIRDEHLAATMIMFMYRHNRPNSPFRGRVGFFDQWFMNIIQGHGKRVDGKLPECNFDECWVSHFSGWHPDESPSNKRWWYDIDNLYGIVNVQTDHWVAVDINFPEETIFVYDSIPTHTDDTKLAEELLFLCRMLPEFLNVIVPHNDRPSNTKSFKMYRVRKDVPINKRPGDCGIFAIKYIECLALGLSFDGLEDNKMMSLRRRLAAELFDEVPSTRG